MATMREMVADLEKRLEQIRKMGGEDKIAKQHARNKMTARERLTSFFDGGTFFEIGAHGTQMGLAAGPDGKDKPPADAVVTAQITIVSARRRTAPMIAPSCLS